MSEPTISGKKLSDLVIGDVFYENDLRMSLKLTVASIPALVINEKDGSRGWAWDCTSESGHNVDYFITEGYEHLMDLSLSPKYVKA